LIAISGNECFAHCRVIDTLSGPGFSGRSSQSARMATQPFAADVTACSAAIQINSPTILAGALMNPNGFEDPVAAHGLGRTYCRPRPWWRTC